MKIYFAGMGPFHRVVNVKPIGVKNVLSSWLEGNPETYKEFCTFIDSGAFTTWKQGKVIKIEDYIRYLKNYESQLEVYANLDVIGSPEGTWDNQQIMEKAGLKPLPTYHLREDPKWLRHYLEKYDYVALGGTVGSHRNVIEPFLDSCFAIIKDYWPKKIHGFGITSLWALKKYPFYSVDSTAWSAGGRFGNVYKDIKLSHNSIGVNPEHHTVFSKALDYKDRNVMNIRNYLKLEKDISYYWSGRGINFK